MGNDVGQRYFQVDVETDRPEALVAKLLRRAIRSTRCAGDPDADAPARTRSLQHALEIVSELRNGLDFEQGGEIAHNLDALYTFIGRSLLDAALGEGHDAIHHALRVLEPLGEAWDEIATRGALSEGP